MSVEELEQYEAEQELSLYREYRDVVGLFAYIVETERRFYLANSVDVAHRQSDGRNCLELTLTDAWVWDMYRPVRFTQNVKVVTYRDVNIEYRGQASPDQPSLPVFGEHAP